MQGSISNLSVKQKEQAMGLRKYITAFAAVIIVTGLTLLGLSFYKGSPNIMIMVLGTIFILLGAFGVYAGLTLRPKAAKAYVIAIFVCMVLCMILLGLELNLLNSWVNTTCQRKSFSALACAQYRHFRWILAVICFVVALPACCSCMFCAYSLQIALSPPRGRPYEYIPVGGDPFDSSSSSYKTASDPTTDL